MQREIKFRGLKKSENEWVYGYLSNIIKVSDGVESNQLLIGKDFEYEEVLPETIGQFTGIHDVDDKEIYEGDILTYLGGIGRVVYDNATAMFIACFPLNRSRWSFDSMEGEIEVVGNIYENLEIINYVISADK